MQLLTNFKKVKSKPYVFNLAVSRSCKRQPKAFYSSVRSSSKLPLLSLIFFHFSINTSKQGCGLKSFLKPHWCFDKISAKYSAIISNMYFSYTLEKFDKMLAWLWISFIFRESFYILESYLHFLEFVEIHF